jgi:hypothetical protein
MARNMRDIKSTVSSKTKEDLLTRSIYHGAVDGRDRNPKIEELHKVGPIKGHLDLKRMCEGVAFLDTLFS